AHAGPPAVARRLGGSLEQGVDGHGTLRTVEDRTTHRPAPLGAARHRGPGLNELLRSFDRIPLSRSERLLRESPTVPIEADCSPFPVPRSLCPIPDSRFPIPDSRFPIPDSRFPTSARLAASVR